MGVSRHNTIFRPIWIQTEVRLDPNQSENGKYRKLIGQSASLCDVTDGVHDRRFRPVQQRLYSNICREILDHFLNSRNVKKIVIESTVKLECGEL